MDEQRGRAVRLLLILSDQEVRTALDSLDEKIHYSTPSEGVPFKNLAAKLRDYLIKSTGKSESEPKRRG